MVSYHLFQYIISIFSLSIFNKLKFSASLILDNCDNVYGFYFSGRRTTNLLVEWYWSIYCVFPSDHVLLQIFMISVEY